MDRKKSAAAYVFASVGASIALTSALLPEDAG